MTAAVADVRAAGVCFVRGDGRVLLLRRTDAGHYWSFPGGKIEEGETTPDAAAREVKEETGFDAGVLLPWTRRVKGGVDFTTFLSRVGDMPDPVLSDEHDLFKWETPDEAMAEGGLHPGTYVALLRFDMDELSLARAMRLGEITSPQRYENVLLIALRITGTGASYRTASGTKLVDDKGEPLKTDKGKPVYSGEYVWRDASLYLNDEFVARCNGLPVIWVHPEGGQLDSKEFGDRVVGTIMLPFIDGDEVWGIAKIYDDQAKSLLETQKLSTSPGVVFADLGVKLPSDDGKQILIEGKPSLIDHLAICELGVWDKGGPAAGVLNQSPVGDTIMADNDTRTDAQKIMDSLKGIQDGMTDMGKRMDAMEDGSKKDRARMDAYDEKAKADAAEDEEKKKADAAAEEEKKKADAAAEAEEEKKKADAAKTAGDKDLHTRLKGVEDHIAGLGNIADFAAAQTRADKAYQFHGDSAAPRWGAGESLTAYQKRLLTGMQKHSPAFKDVDIAKDMGASMLANAERVIYADAITAAMTPASDGVVTLREIVEIEPETGRRIKTFVGSPEACWGAFKQRARSVSRFAKPDNR